MGTPDVKGKRPIPELARDLPDLAGDHIENGTDLGSVQIHNSVIATITRLAALKVAGVIDMSGGLVDGLAGMIGKKSSDRGIRVEFEEGAVLIEVSVILEYGVRIPHVASQVQHEVREAVEQMTGKTVKYVNVLIQSVRPPLEASPARPPEGGTP